MEAIHAVEIYRTCLDSDDQRIMFLSKTDPKLLFYPKPEADAVIARLEHQIEVLNADLTRCQESKAAIGDKCLRLEAEIARYKSNINTTEAATGMCGIYAKLEAEVERLTGVIKKIDDICSDPKKVMMLGIQAFGIVKQLTKQAISGGS